MGRVIFHHLFDSHALSGGIKTIYYHAALLNEMGIESYIYAPNGAASWLNDENLTRWVRRNIEVYEDDVLVFPETLQPLIVEAIQKPYPCRKIIFCQGAYLLLGFYEYTPRLKEWGIADMAINSVHGKALLENVLGARCPSLSLIFPLIDHTLFYPEPKEKIICSFGRKWRDFTDYEALIQRMFHVKYPQFASIPWVSLDGMTPIEVAAIMRKSMICLSLSRLEGLGITALEAMSAGCAVIGFHGGGGLDYARAENGFWHSPEALEEIVDSLYFSVAAQCGSTDMSPHLIEEKIKNGIKTARYYSIEKVKEQLFAFYSRFI